MSIRILLADDHAVVRDGLAVLLASEPDLEVVGSAANGRIAVQLATSLHPDVAVLDISMPDMNGIDAVRRMRADLPELRVVILSMHGNSEHVYQALQAGAAGYLLKESAGAELVTAIRAVHAGRRYLSAAVEEVVVSGYLDRSQVASPLGSLSQRERAVLEQLAEGLANREIARRLNVSVKSVETYRSRMMAKLGLKSLPELVKFAVAHGVTEIK